MGKLDLESQIRRVADFVYTKCSQDIRDGELAVDTLIRLVCEYHELQEKQLGVVQRAQADALSGEFADLRRSHERLEKQWALADMERCALRAALENIQGVAKRLGISEHSELGYALSRRAGTLAGKVEVAADFDTPLNLVPDATPAPDHHNARRLAWREYTCAAVSSAHLPSYSPTEIATAMLAEEEKIFGELK